MNNPDYILELYKYFSKFVPKKTLTPSFKKPAKPKPGYDEFKTEVLAQPDTFVLPDIGTFVVSADIDRVSDRIKNSTGVVLFVEYGKTSLDPNNSSEGVEENLSVTIVESCEFTNNDNLNEALIINNCLNLLIQILDQMQADQTELDSCGESSLVQFPVDIIPVDRKTFFDRAGWSAQFNNKKSR